MTLSVRWVNAQERSAARGESQARAVAVGLSLVAGGIVFAYVVDGHYPLKNWLFFRYARAWALSLAFLGSSFVGGYGLLGYIGGRCWPKREEIAIATALGVAAFGLLVFVLGLVGGLGVPGFVAIPTLLVAVGWRRATRDLPPLLRRVLRLDLRLAAWKVAPWTLGVLGLALLYVQILTPEAFGFDERWYHLPMAQRYALTGSTARFEEGFWQQANPHLASYLYTWAFLTPGVMLFDRLELCAHIEFILFLVTLLQVPLLTRKLAPRLRHPLSALVLLAFPGIYLYDGNLHAGADHVAAFFAIPMALATLRCFREFRPLTAVVAALCAGALVLTKFTAVIVAMPCLFVLGCRGLWLVSRSRPLAASGLITLAGTVLVVASPLWLRNLIWFGDPIYPFLHQHLRVRPWNADAAGPLAVLQSFMSTGPWTLDGVLKALKTSVTFSFVPNDWYVLHRDVPIFGSLFTLTLPCLLFLKRPWRLVAAHACIMLSLVIWYMLHHFDRYLQALLPWMAATTAACFARVWELGPFARGPLMALVALQVVWGGDVPFFRTHNLLGDSPVREATAFLASGFHKVENRLNPYAPLAAVGRATPKNAVVLAHDVITILGIDRNWVTDVHQSRFSYGLLRTPSRVHAELVELGVTHLVWSGQALGRDTLASDFAFLDYAVHHTQTQQSISGYTVGKLPERPPPTVDPDPSVVILSCGAPYGTGIYRLSQLRLPVLRPGLAPTPQKLPADKSSALASAAFVGIERRCHSNAEAGPRFLLAQRRGDMELYVTSKAGP